MEEPEEHITEPETKEVRQGEQMKNMRKKLIVYGSIGIFAAGVSLFLFFNKQDTDNGEDTVSIPDDTAIETEIETETEPAKDTDIPENSDNDTATAPMETDTDMLDTEEDDADYVLYLEDEGIRDNPVFAAFIDKEITAYDAETGENRYIHECNNRYNVYGIHYMAEDLDGDGNGELLVLLQWDGCDGDLLVFHEEDGKLYQWETWEYFMWMRMLEIEYHGNGIFSMGGGAGDIVGRYNTEGKIEYIAKYFRSWGHTEEGKYWKSGRLILYKDGQEERELSWEGIYFHEDDTMEMTPENQANYDEFVAIMYEIWEEIGEGRRIEEIEYEENAKKIPLMELFGN